MSDRAKGAFLTMFGGACWGVSGCTGQYLFTRQGMDSTWLVPIRLLLAGLILCGYYFFRDRRLLFDPWKAPGTALDLVIYGLAGISCCQFTYFLTIQLSTAGTATILQDLAPVFILLVSCGAARRLPRAAELGSVALALAGVLLLTTHGRLDALAISPAALAVGAVSACCVVVYTMYPVRKRYPTSLLQGWSFLMGGIAFGLLFRPWQTGYRPNLAGLAGIAVVVLVGNVLAFNCYMAGVRLIGPQKASLYSFAEPVTAALIGSLLLGSPFTGWDALGFACIFLMMVCLSLGGQPASRKAACAGK